jgi:hypothetical protein
VFVLIVALPWAGVVWVLTEGGMPRWLRQTFVLPAFISSIAWFDVVRNLPPPLFCATF